MVRRASRTIWWPVLTVALLEACGTPPGDSDAAGSTGDTSTSTAPADATETATSTPITATSSLGSDTSAEGSTGAPVLLACLPAEAHGAVLPELSIAGLTVYEGCDPETWVVEHLGSELRTTVDAINATREEGTLFPGASPGLFGVGTGLCCGDPDLACITLYVEQGTDLPGVVAYIDASFPKGLDACFGLEVSIGEPPVPG